MKSWGDRLFWIFLVVVLALRAPSIFDQFQKEGASITPVQISDQMIPLLGQKTALIFWNTWCGPCQIELKRIQRAIDSKELSPNSILAVNLGESQSSIEKYYREHRFSFPFVIDVNNELSSKLLVRATPTVALIDEVGRVKWLSSGISPTLIYRIESFLGKSFENKAK